MPPDGSNDALAVDPVAGIVGPVEGLDTLVDPLGHELVVGSRCPLGPQLGVHLRSAGKSMRDSLALGAGDSSGSRSVGEKCWWLTPSVVSNAQRRKGWK
jgi:hypothetical protein